MEIRTFGGGGRLLECERILSERLADRDGRAFLLPIPTARDNKYITGTKVAALELLPMLDSKAFVIGYNIPRDILREADVVGAKVYDAGADERFLIANAELTARGTVGYILTHLMRDPADMSVGVVGYGRIGIRVIRWLLMLGSRITLYTTRSEIAIKLCSAGISASVIGEGCDFSGIDLLINTAPARQISEKDLPPHTQIIDLASGCSFDPSPRVTKLASIPDAMYPLTAGRLYAESAIAYLCGECR